jgi:hypothetical protein
MIVPVLLLGGGALTLLMLALTGDAPVPDHPPDLPSAGPGQTRWKLVNALLPELQKAAYSSGIALGLLVGWVAKESGGKLATKPQPGPGDTKYDERGYFQLTPEEAKALGLDHNRLSTDATYSINGGISLINKYAGVADGYSLFPRGSSAYWRLVKLIHSMGSGDVQKLALGAKSAARGSSWSDFEQYARSGAVKTKHSPDKWFAFVNAVYDVGQPFGFGGESTIVGGAFNDIPDPLDCL